MDKNPQSSICVRKFSISLKILNPIKTHRDFKFSPSNSNIYSLLVVLTNSQVTNHLHVEYLRSTSIDFNHS